MDRNKAAFRALMKSKKDKKVDHPLARYDDVGWIECKVCKKSVETEGRWTAHLASKDHHEMVAQLKAKLQAGPKAEAVPPPRHATPTAGSARPASSLPDDFFDAPKAKQARHDAAAAAMPPPVRPPKPRPPAREVSVASEKPTDAGRRGDGAGEAATGSGGYSYDPVSVPANGTLPAGFFDDPADAQRAIASSQATTSGNMAPGAVGRQRPAAVPSSATEKVEKGVLPEGFFDNEEADKKARGIEIPKRDPVEEMKEFQRAIQVDLEAVDKYKEENEIEAAEEREVRMELERRDFKEKLKEWHHLKEQRKKEALSKAQGTVRKVWHEEQDDEEEDEEDDVEDVIDWRSKRT